MTDNCDYHIDVPSIGECFICKNPICKDCRVHIFFSKTGVICKKCDKIWTIRLIIRNFLLTTPMAIGFGIAYSIIINFYWLFFGVAITLVWILFYGIFISKYNKWWNNINYKKGSSVVKNDVCEFHTQRPAVNTCRICKKKVCKDCLSPQKLCYECYINKLVKKFSIKIIVLIGFGGFIVLLSIYLLSLIPFQPVEFNSFKLTVSSLGVAILISSLGFLFARLYIIHLKNQWKESMLH